MVDLVIIYIRELLRYSRQTTPGLANVKVGTSTSSSRPAEYCIRLVVGDRQYILFHTLEGYSLTYPLNIRPEGEVVRAGVRPRVRRDLS